MAKRAYSYPVAPFASPLYGIVGSDTYGVDDSFFGYPGWGQALAGPGVTVGDARRFPSGSWTLSLWLRLVDLPPSGEAVLFHHAGNSDNSESFGLTVAKCTLSSSGEITASVLTQSGSAPVSLTSASSSGLNLTTGVWYHIAIVAEDGVSLRVYVNNSLAAYASLSGLAIKGPASQGYVYAATVFMSSFMMSPASLTYSTCVSGYFAELAFWKAALGGVEIESLALGVNPMLLLDAPSPGFYYPCRSQKNTPRYFGSINDYTLQLSEDELSTNPPVQAYPTHSPEFSFAPIPKRLSFDTLTFSGLASGAVTRDVIASAPNAVQITGQAVALADHVAGAESTLSLTSISYAGIDVAVFGVFAIDRLTFSHIPDVANRSYQVSASTSVAFSDLNFSGPAIAVAGTGLLAIASAATGRVPITATAGAKTTLMLAGFGMGLVSNVYVSATSAVSFVDEVDYIALLTYRLSAKSTVRFPLFFPVTQAFAAVQRSSGPLSLSELIIRDSANAELDRLLDAPSSSLAVFSGEAVVSDVNRAVEAYAASAMRLRWLASPNSDYQVFAQAIVSIAMSGDGVEETVAEPVALGSVTLTDSARSSRSFAVSATTQIDLLGPGVSNQMFDVEAEGSLSLGDDNLVTLQLLGAEHVLAFQCRADTSILLPGGAIIPGGDSAAGLRYLLMDGISGDWPLSFAEASNGVLLAANGLDPMLRWNGLATTAQPAGLAAPAEACVLSGAGNGLLTGRRAAYQRFIDADGVISNLSPVSAVVDLGRDGWIQAVTKDGGAVTIRSDGHGLATGDVIVIQGAVGLDAINATWSITRVDDDHVILDGLTGTIPPYRGGAFWTKGAAALQYSAVSTPDSPRVTRRQLLRNLDGDMGTFYVDVDTTDLTATSFTSTRTDAELATQEAVPLAFEDDMVAALRYGVPPSHKLSLASHMGRIFAAGERAYTQGHVEVSLGSPIVRGVGTAWTSTLAGRLLYAEGATKAHEIASVLPDSQILILSENYSGPSDNLASYAVRPAPAERRLVYFSEPNLPEAWPPWNAFSVPECSDEIVGLMVLKSFLYVVERRHIHRFTFRTDPARDGFVFQKANRGCVNNRCWSIADNLAYMLDEFGVHAFDGEESRVVSTPIQNLFQADAAAEYRIDWSADRTLWHASHDPVHETIRWFVTLVGKEPLTHAICYDYRKGRFWLESYAEPITSSCVGTAGYRRAICGTTIRRALVLGEGALDWLGRGTTETIGSLRGAVSAATDVTVQLAGGGLPSNLVGVPCQVVSGNGKGQTRLIVDSTDDTLTVLDPWDVRPEAGDVIQIGGIDWRWKSGWFRYADDEAENPRDIEVVFQPTNRDSTFNIRLYFNHDAKPRSWFYDQNRDQVSVAQGDPDIVVAANVARGWALQRLSGHGDPYAYSERYVAVELQGVQTEEPTRIYQLVVNGAEP